MEFYIKQNTDLPILKMEFVNDGRTDSYKILNDEIVNAKIRFSMMDLNTNQKIVFMENAYLTDKIKIIQKMTTNTTFLPMEIERH